MVPSQIYPGLVPLVERVISIIIALGARLVVRLTTILAVNDFRFNPTMCYLVSVFCYGPVFTKALQDDLVNRNWKQPIVCVCVYVCPLTLLKKQCWCEQHIHWLFQPWNMCWNIYKSTIVTISAMICVLRIYSSGVLDILAMKYVLLF